MRIIHQKEKEESPRCEMKVNKVKHVPTVGTAIKDVFLVKITADFTFLEIALSAASNCG